MKGEPVSAARRILRPRTFSTNFAAVDADDEITVAEDPEPFVGGSHIADEKAGRTAVFCPILSWRP